MSDTLTEGAAAIVSACILAGGRAMTVGVQLGDGQIWRVECERVDSQAQARVSRAQRIAELEQIIWLRGSLLS